MRSIVMSNSRAVKPCRYSPLLGSRFASLIAALAAMVATTAAAAAPRETGVWIDDTGKGAVKIDICGNKLCGRIVWLKDTVNANGEPLIDRYNPDPAKQSRRICGLQILGELQQMQGGGFDLGWVYDPKVGNSYSVAIDLIGPDKLQVTGYKGVRFLGKKFVWTRAEEELPSCDASAAKGPAAEKGTKSAGAKPAVAKPAIAKPSTAKASAGKSAVDGNARSGEKSATALKAATSQPGNSATATKAKSPASKKEAAETLPWASDSNATKKNVQKAAQ